MGSQSLPNKILQDIADCVSGLKKESLDGRNPINDDSTKLHRFEEKLELVLLLGLIEKPGILGPKKSYWNYICACFTSSKKSHEGIHFVKSIASLKTHLGRGRAFIRFCLAQKCLADTLQCCFMNQRVSREFYSERSLLVQEKLWSFLVTSLYELNELNFDLSTGHTELDISWPKFARKVFTSSEPPSFLQKDMSADTFHSLSTQDELYVTRCSHSKSLTALDSDILSSNLSVSTNVPVLSWHKVPCENMCLQEEVQCLKEEKLKLQNDIQNLQFELKTLQQQMNLSFRGNCSEPEMEKALPVSNATTEPKVSYIADLDDVEKISSCDGVSFFKVPSVKQKIEEDTEGNITKCDLQQDNFNTNSVQVSNAFDICDRNSKDYEMGNICLPQSHVYILELLFEFKTVIDDIDDIIQKSEVSLAVPHILRLKKIRSCLEEIYLNQFDKSKSRSNFNNFVDNCVTCIKTFAAKQENVINSVQEKINLSINQNQNIYSKITVLKNLLKSYGFLKLSNEKEIASKTSLLPFDINFAERSTYESFSCDNIAHDPLLKRIIVPLIPVLNSVFLKVHNLNTKMTELQFGLDSSYELNDYLITRVQDQEIHLKGVTKALEEAQHLVSVLKTQHRKLQSAEGVLKYDLQEKRKLLTRLRQQLENTREDFNLVHLKNSKSEAEWQDLRKEFVQRHKQTSEESGFVDDKISDEYEPTFSASGCDCSFSEEATTEDNLNNIQSEIVYEDVPIKKSRLELLEEQCQSLYSSLLQGSKKRQDIDKRLETMCNAIEKSNNGSIHSSSLTSSVPASNRPDMNDTSVNTSSEDICQNLIFSSDNFNSSPHSSSDIGSLNSECSSCIPGIFNDTSSCDSCCCRSKPDSCISLSPFKLQIGAIQNLSTMEQDNEDSYLYSDSTSSCNLKCKNENAVILSSECMELSENDTQTSDVHNLSMSHVDSLLIKKKDLEESLKILEIDNKLISDRKRCLDADGFAKQIEALEEEKKLLLNKMQDLETKTLIISTELDNTKQQLILSKAAKEHEVAALQFQLNTEALKYERALKGFSEQSKGLESMKEKITDQEELILALEEALTEIRLDRENEKEAQWQELEDIHIAFEAREQECITLSQDLEKCLTDVEKEKNKNELLLSQLEELKVYSIREKESMIAQLIHLQNDSKALKRKLLKLLKEKDLLWKRNNHLFHIQKVKIDDRWMNDSEVSHCLGCKNNFSFLIRKHHCRLCGRIFCYSCSNNWILTASSSKKIRACNECFMQHIEMKKDVRRGSDVPQVEDDSGDEHDDLSFVPMSNESFTSEVPSSITNSVVSLPITQKQSTPRFASAPDLRYVIQPDDPLTSILLAQESVLEESNQELLFSNKKTELVDQNAADISSDDCTSITLEEDISKISRLKEISTDDIKTFERGFNSELIIPPGEKAELPIYCQTCPIVVKWCFISSYQDIPVTITHTDTRCNSEPVLFFQDKHMMQDEMEISLPGYYVFHFDNSLRAAEVQIQYNISFKNTSEVEPSFKN